MPNVNRIISPFLGSTGNPDTYVELPNPSPGAYSPYAGGDLGNAYDYNDRTYQKVTLDSGATSATPTGAVAANQVAFWKDRTNYVVTNDARFALFNNVANSYANNVAGIFRATIPPGSGCFVLIKGRAIPVKSAGATAGMMMVANQGSTAADASGTAIGTPPPTQSIGVAIASSAGGNTSVDVDMPNIP
jgi:hypothetical protein